jgi:hypothetical protein
MKNNWKDHIKFSVNNLHLDIANPRTDIGRKITENGVVKELLKEDVFDLAKDIAQGGFLAASTLMVIEETGKQIVVDGNRRLLAIQILQDPNIVKNLLSKNYLDQLNVFSKNLTEDLSLLPGVLYPSRKEAEKEMAKMHLAGVAVKQWILIRQCRYFQKRLDEEKDLSINTLSELLGVDKVRVKKNVKTFQLYGIAKNKLPKIKNSNDKIIYGDDIFLTDKFQRLVVNEEGERFLGYRFSDENQRIEIKEEKIFLLRLKQVLEKLYDKNFGAQFSSKDRLNFFRTIQTNFLNTADYKKQRRLIEEQVGNGQKPMFDFNQEDIIAGKDEVEERSKRKPSGLFLPSSIPYKLSNSSLQKLYDELKDISVLSFPNATHDLLRSFLECSLVEYLTDKEKYTEIKKDEKHTPKLSELLTYIIKNKTIDDDNVLENLEKIKKDWDKPYSLQRMNSVNHNKDYASTEKDVRQCFGMLEKLFRIILNSKEHEK